MVATFALAAVVCAVHVVNELTIGSTALSLGQEGSPATIATATLFAVGGVLAIRLAVLSDEHRAGWAVLGLVGILFGAEEGGLMLHERFEAATSTGLG